MLFINETTNNAYSLNMNNFK